MKRFLISPIFILGLFALIFVFHILASAYGWYWSVPWVDNIHHFLGGVWIASVVFLFLESRPNLFNIRKSFLISLILALGIVALAGIAWEFFEFGLGKYAENIKVVYEKMQLQDTLGDLFFDLAGGLAVAVLYLRFNRNS